MTRANDAASDAPRPSELPGAEILRRALDRYETIFEPGIEQVLARAPGRLDVMGGIADYSGSLVLEWPLACATWVMVSGSNDPSVRVVSAQAESIGGAPSVVVPLAELFDDESVVRERLRADPARTWAAYALGVVTVLAREFGEGAVRSRVRGLTILVASDVPVGAGVSSSAALEVATMAALAKLLEIKLDLNKLALLAQRVEHAIVGAPCGVMDQMTAAYGVAQHLVALRCQPAELEPPVALPAPLAVFGIDSGVRHEVKGDDYASVRAAAFMGHRVLAELAGLRTTKVVEAGRDDLVTIEDARWRGYLANVTVDEWRAFETRVPAALTGAEFLAKFGGTTDRVTRVDPARTYGVRVATAHPIFEHARVRAFRDVLGSSSLDEAASAQLGAWMFESHASYGACGLGSSGTDRIVALARATGPSTGIYGARITGGGSGGTVALLAHRDAEAEVRRIAAAYASETSRGGTVLCGSSPGVRTWHCRTLGTPTGNR